jgi:hypothetical protein
VALLLVHEAETGMYDRENLDQELATLRTLIRELYQELAMIELAVAGAGTSTEITSPLADAEKPSRPQSRVHAF